MSNDEDVKLNKTFTVGPVEMYPSTKEVRMHEFAYFRSDEFSKIVKKSLDKLSKLLGNNEDCSLVYFASSGTAVMEAVIENCVGDQDKVLVINGGTFGQRFCELLDYHNKNFNSIDLDWKEALTLNHLNKHSDKGYTMLFVNLHETQTGQLYDIKMLSDFCKQNEIMLVVDAISAFLADEYNMERYNIDLTIISSQKGLCLSPGMSFASFSKRMIEKIQNMPLPSSKYFDFKDYLSNIKRGQTPYTPPVLVMYELQDMLNLIEKEGGLNARIASVKQKAQYFRKKAAELGFIIPNYPLSNALTPLYFEDVNADEVVSVLRNRYKIFVNPCGGKLAKYLFRVAHIGNTSMEDIDELLEKIMLSVQEVRTRSNKTRIYGSKTDINYDKVKDFWELRAQKSGLNAVLLGNQKDSKQSDLRNEKETILLKSFFDKGIKKLSVLDIGCGMGRWANNLKEDVAQYCGIDFSDKFIKSNKVKFEKYNNLQFYTMPATDIDLSVLNNNYNLVIITGVLMYINDKNLASVLETIKQINPQYIYLQESVAVLSERLTLKGFYSDELNTQYSAIYRTKEEYEDYLKSFLPAYKARHAGLLLEDDTGARKETNAFYWFLERKFDNDRK